VILRNKLRLSYELEPSLNRALIDVIFTFIRHQPISQLTVAMKGFPNKVIVNVLNRLTQSDYISSIIQHLLFHLGLGRPLDDKNR